MNWIVRKIKGGVKCLKEHGFRYTARLFIKKAKGKLRVTVRNALQIINGGFIRLGKRVELGFITVIKAKTYIKDERYGKVYFIFLFGKQIYPRKNHQHTNTWVDPNQPVMYFKINRMSDYAKACVQHWVNIAYHMKADYYFICDNKQLQYHLLRTVNFPGADIKWMASERKRLKTVCKNISSPHWKNATYAHLTPFYHHNSKTSFWTIDADDTMICLLHKRSAQLLDMVQKVANKNDISVISLDMWRSRTIGRHWSWGVAFVRNNVDYHKLFNDVSDMGWAASYQDVDVNFNLDWYFTYLKDYKGISIQTFYAENMYFIHWGNFLRAPIASGLFVWKNGKVLFPILQNIFKSRHLGTVAIADCIKIPLDIFETEGLRFMENEVSTVKWSSDPIRKLNNMQAFSRRENSLENL